ncbi:MAG: P-loop NTPase [Thermoflexales bacterium]|nr:P-loop NTPase [Thermoflexales bacterium]
MPKIITVHSFRRGTGKSIISANLAAMLAMAGQRVGVLDADVLSPSLHWLLGLGQTKIDGTLTDFLLDQRSIEQTAHDVTSRLSAGAKGRLFLIPASDDALRIAQLLRDRYESDRLGEGCQHLIDQLALDVLVVDTHAGLNQDSLAAMAMSDVLLIVLRLDQQDYQGTAVTIDVARRLGIPALSLIVNQAPESFQPPTIIAQLEQTYHCPVAGLLPLSQDLMVQSESSLFVLNHARHPITTALAHIAAQFGA